MEKRFGIRMDFWEQYQHILIIFSIQFCMNLIIFLSEEKKMVINVTDLSLKCIKWYNSRLVYYQMKNAFCHTHLIKCCFLTFYEYFILIYKEMDSYELEKLLQPTRHETDEKENWRMVANFCTMSFFFLFKERIEGLRVYYFLNRKFFGHRFYFCY